MPIHRVPPAHPSKFLPWLFAAGPLVLAAVGLSSANCGGENAASAPRCDPKTFKAPKCKGNDLVACSPDGFEVTKNCKSDNNQQCLLTGKGEAECGKPCPDYVDSFGACDDKHLQTCDGKILRDVSCTSVNPNNTCSYMLEGNAACTRKYCATAQEDGTFYSGGPDAGSDAAALRTGFCSDTAEVPAPSGVQMNKRCFGRLYQDKINCTEVDPMLQCRTDSTGAVRCAKQCPPGLDLYGKCGPDDMGKTVGQHCDGEVYIEDKCGDDQTCGELDRYGVGCKGCGAIPPEGQCSHSKTQRVLYCADNGEKVEQSCIARGGSCAFNPDLCRYDCMDVKDQPGCADEGLKPGEAKCKLSKATGYASIVLCTSDSKRYELECPAAKDGSVSCKEFMPGEMIPVPDGGTAPLEGGLTLPNGKDPNVKPMLGCSVDCGPTGKKCTDRGVLVECNLNLMPDWMDCAEAGGVCIDDGTDAYCGCAGELPPHASRCEYGKKKVCSGGRIVTEACSCTPPN